MKIGLIQQYASEDIEENIKRGLKAFEIASGEGVDLIAYAELSFEPFYPQRYSAGKNLSLAQSIPGPMTDIFSEAAAKHNVVTVFNMYEKDGEITYDASPLIDSDGKLLGVTRMMHITDFKYFHERDYYTPSEDLPKVFKSAVGNIGIANCYDRHYPEVMRSLKLQGAELVIIPQAQTVGEYPEGLFEAEVRVASFQNGYYSALINRVGLEGEMEFAGKSFITAPDGKLIASAVEREDAILYADLDFSILSETHASKYFLKDRQPGNYKVLS